MADLKTESTLTCPNCDQSELLEMPVDRCVIQVECKNCKALIKPKKGDCCVFCSFGDVPCPPEQKSDSKD